MATILDAIKKEKDGKAPGIEDLMDLSRAAESAERYEDMCAFMKEVIQEMCKQAEPGIKQDHRNMLSVAYKNVVGSKRQSMRSLNEQDNSDENNKELYKKYTKLVQSEVVTVCNEVLNVVVSGPLVPGIKKDGDAEAENTVFWLKMCGDYCRYLAEIPDSDDLVALSADSKKALEKSSIESEVDVSNTQSPKKWAEYFYGEAMAKAQKSLPETHPTRLGLALNYSVCHYEILNQQEEATKLAKTAFDAAIEKLDTLNDSSYKDSTLIMQLLRDNLTLWTSQNEKGADDAQ